MRTVLEYVVPVALWSSGGFIAAILVYALGSFLLMRPYATARTLGVSVRSILRETVLAALTQPFLLLHYVIGHRMEPLFIRRVPRTNVPVILVHGYMQNRVGFLGLARALAQRGIGPLYGINYPWFASIPSNAKRLERFVERVRAESKAPVVDLVCHSMGGLVATEMLSTSKEPAKVRRLVTIATPHAGIAWRGPLIGIGAANLRRGSKLLETYAGYKLAIPTLSIFSSHDNVVYPKETSQLAKRGGRDVEVEGFGHLSILFAPAVAEYVASFLSEPDQPPVIVPPAKERDDTGDVPGKLEIDDGEPERAGAGNA